MAPRISVITASYNRRELLLRKLESLQRQTLSPDLFEWLVCINGSTDGSAEALQVPTQFRLESIEVNENLGPGAGRNAAAARARGDILYFSDDDCVLTPALLEQHLARQTSLHSVVIGAIHFDASHLEPPLKDSVWHPSRVNYWNLNGANTSLPRDAFQALGGFDRRLKGYGGEDLLLGYRLRQLGHDFIAAPEAITTHIGVSPTAGRDPAKAYSAGQNAAYIASLYPELAYRLGVHPALMTLKRLVFGQPLARLWQKVNASTLSYEKAYFEGARAFKYDHT